MNLFAQQFSLDLLTLVAMAAVMACVLAWAWVVLRLRRGQSVMSYERRRLVPWQAFDLALVVLFYIAVLAGAIRLAGTMFGLDTAAQVAAGQGQATTEHAVARLMAQGNVWVLLLCVISAAVVAPLTEEFFFRVLLQGWLEALERRWRRRMPPVGRIAPRGMGPIVLTSLLFAWMHFRVAQPQDDIGYLTLLLALGTTAHLLVMAFAIALVRWRVGATAADLGWAPERFRGDVKVGLAAFAAVAAPIYAMQLVLPSVLPAGVAPDPLPLLFFSFVLGAICFRTHRITPVIVLHAALNGTSLLLAWLG